MHFAVRPKDVVISLASYHGAPAAGLILAAGLALAGPSWAGPTLEQRLQAHKGQVVILNFWASWCEPCRREMPVFAEISRRYGARGIRVVGASIDEAQDRPAARRLVRELGVRYPVWYDGSTEDMKSLRLGTAVPATVILDRDGQPRFRVIGEVKEPALASRLDWLLSDRSAEAPGQLVLPPGVTPEHFAEHETGESEDEHAHEHAKETTVAEAGSAVPT